MKIVKIIILLTFICLTQTRIKATKNHLKSTKSKKEFVTYFMIGGTSVKELFTLDEDWMIYPVSDDQKSGIIVRLKNKENFLRQLSKNILNF